MEKQKITKKEAKTLMSSYVTTYLTKLEKAFNNHNDKIEPLMKFNETLTATAVADLIIKDLFIIED